MSREAALQPLDRELFYEKLKQATHYHEWGSGGSTVQAARRGLAVVSIESDARWHAELQQELADLSSVDVVLVDLQCAPNNWGRPGPASDDAKRAYSSAERAKGCDMVLIDGRFRVACALKLYTVIDERCTVCFDDFLFRPRYREVLRFYDIVESTPNESMVVLRKKTACQPPSPELIAQWEQDSF